LDITYFTDFYTLDESFTPAEADLPLPEAVTQKKRKIRLKRKKKETKVMEPIVMDAEAVESTLEGTPEEMREAAVWLRRVSYSILGAHAPALSGQLEQQAAEAPVPQVPPPDTGFNLLDISNSTVATKDTTPDKALESTATPAMLSILGRLKEGCLFEDDQMRSCCLKGLANIAFECGEPFRSDVALFLQSAFAEGGFGAEEVTSQLEAWQRADCALENSLHELVEPILSILNSQPSDAQTQPNTDGHGLRITDLDASFV